MHETMPLLGHQALEALVKFDKTTKEQEENGNNNYQSPNVDHFLKVQCGHDVLFKPKVEILRIHANYELFQTDGLIMSGVFIDLIEMPLSAEFAVNVTV